MLKTPWLHRHLNLTIQNTDALCLFKGTLA
jgi:hypothetical protein